MCAAPRLVTRRIVTPHPFSDFQFCEDDSHEPAVLLSRGIRRFHAYNFASYMITSGSPGTVIVDSVLARVILFIGGLQSDEFIK